MIEEVIAFDIDTTLVSLGSNMGGVYQLVGDLSLDTHLKPTIVNLGNTNIRFEVSSEGLTFNGSLIPSENIGCAISSSAPNEYFSLPYISSLIITGESRMMSLEFAVPSTTPGLYRGEIQVKAVKW